MNFSIWIFRIKIFYLGFPDKTISSGFFDPGQVLGWIIKDCYSMPVDGLSWAMLVRTSSCWQVSADFCILLFILQLKSHFSTTNGMIVPFRRPQSSGLHVHVNCETLLTVFTSCQQFLSFFDIHQFLPGSKFLTAPFHYQQP